MVKKRLVLTFPASLVSQPVTYHLVKDHNLMINILKALITPKEEGKLVVELSGEKKSVDAGIGYLKGIGVLLQPLAQDIKWFEERCTHCTACIPICPTNALDIDRDQMKIHFTKDTCIACELCISICPYQAIDIQYIE